MSGSCETTQKHLSANGVPKTPGQSGLAGRPARWSSVKEEPGGGSAREPRTPRPNPAGSPPESARAWAPVGRRPPAAASGTPGSRRVQNRHSGAPAGPQPGPGLRAWAAGRYVRQGGPGGPRCGGKRVPGKPRPAAEGPARDAGAARGIGRLRLEVGSAAPEPRPSPLPEQGLSSQDCFSSLRAPTGPADWGSRASCLSLPPPPGHRSQPPTSASALRARARPGAPGTLQSDGSVALPVAALRVS